MDIIETELRDIIDDKRCFYCYARECSLVPDCPIKNNKSNNKYRKLQNWVYLNLKKYGNTVLNYKSVNKVGGLEVVKKDLMDNGFINIQFKDDITQNCIYINAILGNDKKKLSRLFPKKIKEKIKYTIVE